ncbi:MAG TPA: HNH endonuclease [Patescibacteria group bacterium]|nr:HNH endonuclease [Patescibacteria group bacterium]
MPREPWNKGKKLTEAMKKRISESRKGTSAWNKGKPWSEEIRTKISNSRKGKIAWNKGLKWSDAIKKKISRTKLATTLDLKPFYERNRPSKRLRYQVFLRDGFKCRACGGTALETVLEVDHIKPVIGGGKNTLDNLQTLCLNCNRGKADFISS